MTHTYVMELAMPAGADREVVLKAARAELDELIEVPTVLRADTLEQTYPDVDRRSDRETDFYEVEFTSEHDVDERQLEEACAWPKPTEG